MNKKFLVLLATCAVASAAIPFTGCAATKAQKAALRPSAAQIQAYDDEEEPDYEDEYVDEDETEEMTLGENGIFGRPRTTAHLATASKAPVKLAALANKPATKTLAKKTTAKKTTAKKSKKTRSNGFENRKSGLAKYELLVGYMTAEKDNDETNKTNISISAKGPDSRVHNNNLKRKAAKEKAEKEKAAKKHSDSKKHSESKKHSDSKKQSGAKKTSVKNTSSKKHTESKKHTSSKKWEHQ